MALEGLKKAEFIKTPIEGENLGKGSHPEDQLKNDAGDVIGLIITSRNPRMSKPLNVNSPNSPGTNLSRGNSISLSRGNSEYDSTFVSSGMSNIPPTPSRRESAMNTRQLGAGAHFGERGLTPTDRPLMDGDVMPTGRLFNAGQYAKVAPKRMRPQEASATAPAAVEDNTSDYAWSGVPASAPNTHLSMKQMGNTTNRVYDPTKGPSRMGREIIPQGI
jgi:hypothetical protein